MLVVKWIGIFIGCIFIAALFAIWHGPDQRVDAYQKAISEKRVISGMTPEQAERAWGKPARTSTGIFHGVEVTQWFYLDRYVGFREGKATIINVYQQ